MDNAKKPDGSATGRATRPEEPVSRAGPGFISLHKREMEIIAVVVVLSIIALGSLYLYVKAQFTAIVVHANNVTVSGPTSGSLAVTSGGVLTYNYSSYLVEYARVYYSESNAADANLSLTLYPSNPIEPIYLVNVGSYCVQCFLGSTLLDALNSSFHTYGLAFNRSSLRYVSINNLSLVPQGSTLIIPSGLIPNILLPNVTYTERCSKYSNATLASLLAQGDTIVYVGGNFSRSVSCSGQIAQDSYNQISTVSRYENTTQIGNFTANVLYFSNPTFFLYPGENFGSASAAKISNGTLVVLSNYPYSGWNDSATLLAGDLAKVIESRFWLQQLAVGNESLPLSGSSAETIFTLNAMMPYSPTVSEQVNSSYALLRLKLSNSNSFKEYEVPLRYTMMQNGLIGLPAVIPQTGQAQITAQVFNGVNKVVIAQVPIYNQNLSLYISPIPIGQIGPTALYKSTAFSIPSGYYIAELNDQHGALYSSALFFVANALITPIKLNFQNGTFTFAATSEGEDIQGVQYQININGAYSLTGTLQNGLITYDLPKSTNINYGNGTFEVGILGSNYAVPYQYGYTGAQIPPLYIAFAIAAVFLVILNRVLVPTNVEEYFIDVPDMKPPKLEHATEPPDAIISVFFSMNLLYHWNHMPLTPEEVKSGIANNIKYGNARMSITLRNTNAILNTMVNRGLLATANNYFAPVKWIEDSGHSIEYLVIYRKLRDYSIANGMLITELDSTKSSDVIITRKGAQYYIKIYASGMTIKDVEIGQKGRTFIVFLDEENRLNFIERLYKSYGNNAEILKIAINYGNVKLVDSEDLSELKL